MVLHLVAYLLPGLAALVAVPMVLGRVPPNSAYGYRTPKTLSSERIWYPANRFAGWAFLIAFALAITFNLVLWRMHPGWPERTLVLWMCFPVSVAPLASLTASFLYVRRL